jgi:hypothetical protein
VLFLSTALTGRSQDLRWGFPAFFMISASSRVGSGALSDFEGFSERDCYTGRMYSSGAPNFDGVSEKDYYLVRGCQGFSFHLASPRPSFFDSMYISRMDGSPASDFEGISERILYFPRPAKGTPSRIPPSPLQSQIHQDF